MALFLVALTMLFGASLIGFVVIRIKNSDVMPMGQIGVPGGLWISTGLILVASFTIHRALHSVLNKCQARFRNGLAITVLLAVGFLLVQTPSLMKYLAEHYGTEGDVYLHGLIFFLILVHALHVIGGVLPLVYIMVKAHQGAYDHEHYGPVKYISMYWHFLDGVWLVMFTVLLITR